MSLRLPIQIPSSFKKPTVMRAVGSEVQRRILQNITLQAPLMGVHYTVHPQWGYDSLGVCQREWGFSAFVQLS